VIGYRQTAYTDCVKLYTSLLLKLVEDTAEGQGRRADRPTCSRGFFTHDTDW